MLGVIFVLEPADAGADIRLTAIDGSQTSVENYIFLRHDRSRGTKEDNRTNLQLLNYLITPSYFLAYLNSAWACGDWQDGLHCQP
jgi:hypothetical protein